MADTNDFTRGNGGVPANGQGNRAAHEEALLPPVDVIEDAAGITLLADLPGVPREKLNLQLETGSLIIEGELGLDMPQAMQSSHAEVKKPSFRRVFTLSRELDAEKAAAEFRNGVLRLRIPKAEHAQARKIPISVA